MKTTYNWLKDYVSIKVSPQDLAQRLTLAGMEVEKIISADGDFVYELEITPNRPDCLNAIGLARECAAIFNLPLKTPFVRTFKAPKAKCSIAIEDKKDCLRYIGTIVENVSVKSTPAWIQKRLMPLGGRLINNIVDITNFCLMESGQPLHAFDYDKLEGGKIIVRRAKQGEKIVTIDGVERQLDPSILVIADAQRPVAIAGVMGGKDTEVSEATKNVLLESAYFDPLIVRRGARKLGLSTDASYRFERGVDFWGVEDASFRAVRLITETAGGAIKAYADVGGKKKLAFSNVSVGVDQICSSLGESVSLLRCKTILEKLGFKVSVGKKNVLRVTPPSFRRDVTRDVDVVEEIARILGYDQFSVTIPEIKFSEVKEDKNRKIRQDVRATLVGQGLSEAITYSLIPSKSLEKSGLVALKAMRVQNPLSEEQEIMRPSLIPGLLSLLLTNVSHGEKNVQCFELAKVYASAGERYLLGILLCGSRSYDWRLSVEKQGLSFFDLKGIIENVLGKTRIKETNFSFADEVPFVKSECMTMTKNGKYLGVFGKVSPEILSRWDIKQKNVFIAHLEIEALCELTRLQEKYQSIVSFPPVVRDISLAISQEVSFDEIRQLAQQRGAGLLKEINFVEEYRGEKIPGGFRGVVFSLMYQSAQRTLREEEVTQVHEDICRALLEKFKAVRR